MTQLVEVPAVCHFCCCEALNRLSDGGAELYPPCVFPQLERLGELRLRINPTNLGAPMTRNKLLEVWIKRAHLTGIKLMASQLINDLNTLCEGI